MPKIVIKMKDKVMDEIYFNKDTITIGREAENDIQLKNPAVSRIHAKIEKIGGQFYIEDMKSTNGTFLNNKKISWKAGLNNNDTIAIGKYSLTYVEPKKGEKDMSKKLSSAMDETVAISKKKK